MWLSIGTFQILMSCTAFTVCTCLYRILCPIFLFYLVLFWIHVCEDHVMEKKTQKGCK